MKDLGCLLEHLRDDVCDDGDEEGSRRAFKPIETIMTLVETSRDLSTSDGRRVRVMLEPLINSVVKWVRDRSTTDKRCVITMQS